MHISGGRIHPVDVTANAKALRWEVTWVLKVHKGGQCDWNGVGESGATGSGNARVGCAGPPLNAGTRTNVWILGVTFHAFYFGLKPSGLGLIGDKPESRRGLRISGLAAVGAQVLGKYFQLAPQFLPSRILIRWPLHDERLLAQDVGVTVGKR